MSRHLVWAVLMLPSPVVAAAGGAPTELSPVVVTATRTAQTADETLGAVTVIDREEIERRQALSFEDLLRGTAGVEFSNNGGPGKQSSLFLRGTNFNQTLVLVDGVKVGSATTGATAFQDIPVAQIERIEVVRGPRSSLYGSEAMGGVIQIFTRKGGGALTPHLVLGGGSYDTYNASGGLSGGGSNGWFNLYASYEASRGFNACNGLPPFLGCGTIEPDKDGYRNLAGSARAGYRFGNGGELDFSWLGTKAHAEFDGDFVNQTDTLQQVLSGKLLLSPVEGWDVGLSVGHSVDNSDNLKDGRFQSSFDTTRDVLSFQNTLVVARRHTVTGGVDYQRDQVGGSEDYSVDSRTDWGLFGEYLGHFGGNDLQASLRVDDNQQFGTYTTGNGAWGYTFDSGVRVTASYGTAFKAPTFNDLYFPLFGNPDLKPEQSRSLELGLSRSQEWGLWSLNAYQTKIDDLIVARPPDFIPVNFDKARILGVEAIVLVRIAGWDLTTNLTLLDPVNKSPGANNGNLLPRRAEQSIRIDADRPFGRFRAGASLYVEGRRYDDPANDIRLDPYALVGLRLEYAVTNAWRVQARVDNLFDENYETVAYYNQPGRGVYLTLRYEP